MSTFINDRTGVVFSVDDSKDERYVNGHKLYDGSKKSQASKPASSKPKK